MRKKILLTVLFLFLFWIIFEITNDDKTDGGSMAEMVLIEKAATAIEFDKSKWAIKKGWGYAYRNAMLDDLMNDQEVRALEKDALLELLGEPERINGDYLYYTIDQKRAIILPLHTKTLVIKLKEQGTVEWMKIHE